MRFVNAVVVLTASVVLLFNANPSRAAAADHSISGRLIFENAEFSCDRCSATLLASGGRPMSTVYVDTSGHFTFSNVPRGSYTIYAEIEGFEDVNQPVENADSALEASVSIMLVRKRSVKLTSAGGNVVNISEFLERYPKKAVSYFEKGSDSLKRKKNDEAIKYLRNAVELAPTFYEAHNQLGIAYRDAGRIDDAEIEFIKAHELNSTGVDPLLNLTTIYLDEGKPERAVTASEEAVKANSRSAPAFFSLGIALYKAAMPDRAEAALKRALELAPKMANIRLMLANVYLKLRRYDSTLDQLDHYIAENPKGEQIQAAQQMRGQLLKAKEAGQP